MATNPLPLFLLLLLIAATSARPCKTIFYLSSTTTTTTYYPLNPNSKNPNSPNPFLRSPSYVTLILTTTTRFRNPCHVTGDDSQSSPMTSSSGILPMKLYSSVSSSLGERSKDIMSVVGALLFGVGCGALTAATMFFVWALCSPRGYDSEDDGDSDDDDDDEEEKKMGYVAIPSNHKVVDDDLKKKPAPLAKEVV